MFSQIPNLLTLLRIAACPVLVLLLSDRSYDTAILLFLAAGITDGLDGYIAKRYDCVSSLGAILDPIADKLLIASAYIMLAILQDIPFWLLIVVMFRDLVIVVGYLVLVVMGDEIPMNPSHHQQTQHLPADLAGNRGAQRQSRLAVHSAGGGSTGDRRTDYHRQQRVSVCMGVGNPAGLIGIIRKMSRQTLIPVSAEGESSFDSFHTGDNAELLAELRRIVRGVRATRVVYFWGETGSGKTHLLNACCHLARSLGKPHAYLPWMGRCPTCRGPGESSASSRNFCYASMIFKPPRQAIRGRPRCSGSMKN